MRQRIRGLDFSAALFLCPGTLLNRCMRQSARERPPERATVGGPGGPETWQGRVGGSLQTETKDLIVPQGDLTSLFKAFMKQMNQPLADALVWVVGALSCRGLLAKECEQWIAAVKDFQHKYVNFIFKSCRSLQLSWLTMHAGAKP